MPHSCRCSHQWGRCLTASPGTQRTLHIFNSNRKDKAMNDRAKALANFYNHDVSASAYWYEDAIVLTLMVTATTQAAWAKALRKYVVEQARSDDGMLGVLILRIPEDALHVGVMGRIGEVADEFGEKLMYRDNRHMDSNTVERFVEQISRPKLQSHL